MSQPNLVLVENFRRAMHEHGPAAAIRQYGTEDIVWWACGIGEVQGTIDTTLRIMRENCDSEGLQLTIHGAAVGEDRVAIEATVHGNLLNGERYENDMHVAYLIRDGRVAGVREYFDTARTKVWEPIFAAAQEPTG